MQNYSWRSKDRDFDFLQYCKKDSTNFDWDTYPILNFTQAPKIEMVLINRPGMPFLGTSEAAQGPTPAAIANAIFDAAGIRLREIPFTQERVRAAVGVI